MKRLDVIGELETSTPSTLRVETVWRVADDTWRRGVPR